MKTKVIREPKPTEISERLMVKYIPFKYLEAAPVNEVRKPTTERGKRKEMPPDVALRIAKRLLGLGMSAHAASQQMGFGRNYLSNIRFRHKTLWNEVMGDNYAKQRS